MNHDEYKEKISAFLDGELNDAERDDVLAHLETCEACRAYLAELTALHDALGDTQGIDAPEGFADGVLARLHEEEKTWAAKPPKRRAWRAWAGVAACAAVVLLAGSMWRFTHMGNAATADSAAPESARLENTTTTASAPASAAPEEAESTEDASDKYEVLEYAVDAPGDMPMVSMANNGSRDGSGETPAVLTLYGEGAEAWLAANSYMADEDGVYWVTCETLYDLPEELTPSDESWQETDVGVVRVRAAETEEMP